jgi:hypothetical protein
VQYDFDDLTPFILALPALIHIDLPVGLLAALG